MQNFPVRLKCNDYAKTFGIFQKNFSTGEMSLKKKLL